VSAESALVGPLRRRMRLRAAREVSDDIKLPDMLHVAFVRSTRTR
jgi:hypothetical protein